MGVEVCLRLVKVLVKAARDDAAVREALSILHVVIIPVMNPDGYQYSHDEDRSWRKNLRDNDGDGRITDADGVDLNRNFDAWWGLNDGGSDSAPGGSCTGGRIPSASRRPPRSATFTKPYAPACAWISTVTGT